MKKLLYRAGAATVLGLSVLTGAAAADNSGTISGVVGSGSSATVSATSTNNTTKKNNTNLNATSNSHLKAYSGHANSMYNTGNSGGGSAQTGAVTAANAMTVTGSVTNGSGGASSAAPSMNATGTISGTIGANSDASVTSTQTNNTKITNNTNVNLTSNSSVYASSGDANSMYNTGSGSGSATTGAVDASNTVKFDFDVTNN